MNACTIVARNYLPLARVLADSFLEHHPDGRLTVLVLDDLLHRIDGAKESFDVVHLDEIIGDQRELHRMAAIYEVTELATAVKPMLLRHLLAEGGSTHIVYLDPDIEVFANFDDVSDLAVRHSIVLTPHTVRPMARDGRKPTEADILGSGVYNLGFLAIGPGSEEFLEWWWERLRRDCIIDHQRMIFTDQRWIDFVPGYFPHLILRDPTLNVAYWNLDTRQLRWSGERYEVDGVPLRCFHYSGYRPERPWLLSRHQGDVPRILLSEQADVARICANYAKRLRRAGLATSDRDRYAWDVLPDGMPIDARMRRVYRTALTQAEAGQGDEPPDPFGLAGAPSFLDWLTEVVSPGPCPVVSRYLTALWEERPDLQLAFPDLPGTDGAGYLEWVKGHGVDEEAIPARLLPAEVPANSSPFRTAGLEEGVNVAGYFRAELGVGEGGRLLVDILAAAGVPMATFGYGDTANRQEHPFGEQGGRDAPYDINVVCVNADRMRRFAAHVGPQYFTGRRTIGMWAWEIEDFPSVMHDGFEFVDEVWAVSTFTADAIRRVSPVPVMAVPHAITVPTIDPSITRADLHLPDGRFVFLVGFDFLSNIERKNPFAAIKAFKQAFSPGEGPVLVIKTINAHHRMTAWERLHHETADHPDIILFDRYLTSTERYSLMALSDCYVSLHRAEGFGLALAESMALGKPVIATGYSGNLDFMDAGNSFLVAHEPVPIPPGCEPYPEGASWAEPSVDDACRLMRLVHDDGAVVATRTGTALRDIAERHTPKARAASVKARLREIREARQATPTTTTAPARAIDRVARHLSEPPGHAPTEGRFGAARGLARRAVVRALRPYWWWERALDGAILDALREAEGVRHSERSEMEAALDAVRRDMAERVRASEGAHVAHLRRIDARLDDTTDALAGIHKTHDALVHGRPLMFGRGIDAPGPGATVPRGPVQVSGWAVTGPHPVSRVEVSTTFGPVVIARIGEPRADVVEHFPVPEAGLSGFSAWLDLTGCPPDVTEILITVTAVTTASTRISLPVLRVGLEAPCAPVIRRPPAPARRATRPRAVDDEIRLLVLSHDLGRGGAQGWLSDVLGRLRQTRDVAATVVSPTEGPLRDDLEREAVAVHVRSSCPIDDADAYDRTLDELDAWAASRQPDVVLGNTLVSFPAVDLAARLGVPSVLAVHESYALPVFWKVWSPERDMDPYVAERARAAFAEASAVLFVSDATRRLYEGLGDPVRFHVIPHAVDVKSLDVARRALDRNRVRDEQRFDEDDVVLLCVGSFEPRKGQALLARAFSLIAPEHPEARLVMVGDRRDAYSMAVRHFVVAAGLSDRVRIHPFDTDVAQWYSVADIAVCPSDNESMPGVVLEAMAAELPVVGTDVFGIPEVVVDAETGWLCPPNDLAALADVLRRALGTSRPKRQDMGRAARLALQPRHDAERRARHIGNLLAELTSTSNVTSG